MRPLPLTVLLLTLVGCGSQRDAGQTLIITPGEDGAGGSGQAGQTTAGSGGEGGAGGPGGSGQAGDGPAGKGGAGGSSGSSGQGGAGAAGAGGSGAGGSAAGSGGSDAGSGGGGAAGGGSGAGGGGSGAGGAPVEPSVAFMKPADGAEVSNPVAFSLKAQGVTTVGLVADDQFSLPLTWDPVSSATHDFDYTFSTLGGRTLVLSGYIDGQAAPAATATITLDVVNPTGSVCDGVDGASFQPPSVCDKLSGNTTSEIPDNNFYATSWFGCYFKSDGSIYKDPFDNCEFACGNKGLCPAGQDGPTCEANLKWFAADADRFGCGARIRLTNCANGKSVVLAVLDRGPNCKSVEQKYGAPVLDMSHDAMTYLFDGKTYGGSDKKGVVVESVDGSTPLGPTE